MQDPAVTSMDYSVCTTLSAACQELQQWAGQCRLLAGGTDLLVEFRQQGRGWPARIVDISRVRELHGVAMENDRVTIGPLTTHSELARAPLLEATAPLLATAASLVGSPQVRNRGTIGGNLMNAAPCADTIPPLVALDASVVLTSVRGERQVAVSALFDGPYRTRATPEEVLTSIRFPALPAAARCAFIKLGRRNALSIARLSVAAVIRYAGDGSIAEARIVPGAAFPVWHRVPEAERLLAGNMPSRELFVEAGTAVSAAVIRESGGRWSTEYKKPVIAVLVRRVLELCATRRDPE